MPLPNPWGTLGPYQIAGYEGDTEGGMERQYTGPIQVDVNGRQYLRVGPSPFYNEFANQALEGDMIYDPRYGRLVSSDLVQRVDPGGWDWSSVFPVLLAAAPLAGIVAGAAAGAGAAGAGAFEGAGAAGAWGGAGAADIAGLTQMGIEAGLSGSALDAFVASGGTMGSTAAGGGVGAGTGGGMWDWVSNLIDTGSYLDPETLTSAQEYLDSAEFLQDYDWGGQWGQNADFNQFAESLQNTTGTGPGGEYTWKDLSKLPNIPQAGTGEERRGLVDLANNIGGLFGNNGLMSLLGPLFGSGLGVLGSNAQADAYRDVSQGWIDLAREQGDRYFTQGKNRWRQLMGFGMPYRDQLEDLMADPTSFYRSPYVQRPLNQATDTVARALSMSQGNPALSGTALTEMNNFAANNLFSRFGEFAGLLGNLGQMGINPAVAAGNAGSANAQNAFSNLSGNAAAPMLGAANQAGGPYNAIGYGLNSIMNNPYGMGSGWGGWKTEFDGSGL